MHPPDPEPYCFTGLKGSRDLEYIKQTVKRVVVPEFVPKAGVRIQSDPNDEEKGSPASVPEEYSVCAQITEGLPSPSSLPGYRMSPAEFEKDDDANFHIDFITAASNLRASNYSIAGADSLQTKRIAGKIIPAIATTTAMVCKMHHNFGSCSGQTLLSFRYLASCASNC
jgi:ubiquitin-activating enzyme E1